MNTKFIFRLLIVLFTLAYVPVTYAQDRGGKKERRKARRMGKKGQGPSNSYIDRKAKNKPSAKISRENKKDLKKKNRAIKKQKKRLRKKNPGR